MWPQCVVDRSLNEGLIFEFALETLRDDIKSLGKSQFVPLDSRIGRHEDVVGEKLDNGL